MAALIIHCFFLLSVLRAGLFETLEKKTESNAADCTKLLTEEKCKQVGACIWGGTCTLDQCYERTVLTTSACKTGISDYSCSRVVKAGDTPTNSVFCVNDSRVASFTTLAQICTLESGSYKFVELAACKSISGCGPLNPLAGEGESYYVCQEGTAPSDPCVPLAEEVCPYVGPCMWEGGGCVQDPCWEQTYTSSDACRSDCTKHLLNPSGTPEYGYCKSGNHDLHSPCNLGTGTTIVSKQVACTWAGSNIPSNCNKITTISKFDGDDLYVCDPEEKTFTVENSATSLNSFLVVLFTLVLLFVMM